MPILFIYYIIYLVPFHLAGNITHDINKKKCFILLCLFYLDERVFYSHAPCPMSHFMTSPFIDDEVFVCQVTLHVCVLCVCVYMNKDLFSGMLIFICVPVIWKEHTHDKTQYNRTRHVCVYVCVCVLNRKRTYARLLMFGTVHSCICRHYYQHHKLSQYYLNLYMFSIRQTLDKKTQRVNVSFF